MDIGFIKDICEKYGKVFITLENKRVYSGEVVEFGEDSLHLIDRDGEDVYIKYSAIDSIAKAKEKRE
jgi:ribosome maturation factor RimP